LAAAAVAASDPAVCVDCGTAGGEEASLLQKQGVLAHSIEEAPSEQMDHMGRPPKFLLALAAKQAAARKAVASSSDIELDLDFAPQVALPSADDESIGTESAEPSAVQYAVAFTPYFNYRGNLNVQGIIAVQGSGLVDTATQTLSWQLMGLDPRCKTTPEGVANACGIHIHQGVSCYEDAGGHYWNKSLIDNDPWASVTYQTRRFASHFYAMAVGVEVVTGLTNFDVLGHTMIVHDYTGARVACGIIIPHKLAVPAFTPYFSYTGDLKVEGAMAVSGMGAADAAGQTLAWSVKGVDPRCSSGANSEYANSCGIHIHVGTDCTSDAFGHYWNTTTYSDDPWSVIGYTSHKWFGTAVYAWEKQAPVVTGFQNSLVNGHTMIVHDYTGGRIACGIISPYSEVANAFVKYYTYAGDLQVSGWVKVVGSGVLEEASQELSWNLAGVDPACKAAPGPGDSPNACGVHIHVGMDCTSDAGGHYFAVSTDPWISVKYKTLPGGYARARMQKVDSGLTNYDVLGHTMIVHDSTGARIACGILNIASE